MFKVCSTFLVLLLNMEFAFGIDQVSALLSDVLVPTAKACGFAVV